MKALAAAVTASLLAAGGSLNQNPAVPDVLKAGAAYAATYAQTLSGIVLEEQAMLTEIAAGRAMVPKRIASDVTFVSVNGRVVPFRDAYAIDTKPMRERTLRIAAALGELTQQSLEQAQEYARQSAYLFIANTVLRGSDPTLAFAYLDPDNQHKLTYRLDGRRTTDGVEVVGLRFQEPTARDKVYLLGTPGNAYGSGRFWIHAATGAVHQTDLWLESPTESASVSVQFKLDAARKILLPSQLSGTFEERELGAGPQSSATARTVSRRIEVLAKYSNTRYSPIK